VSMVVSGRTLNVTLFFNNLAREKKPKKKVADFNKFNLQGAMLKDNYDSGSSRPSSLNTMKTGKKTLGTVYNRKIAEQHYGADCRDLFDCLDYLKKTSVEKRKTSNHSRKGDIRSVAGQQM